MDESSEYENFNKDFNFDADDNLTQIKQNSNI